ncbi:MAG TPA: J domain-containing protein [Caulifigura sp.]|jgi:hypothetical protein|nr:J domain-containing protein [Caulifigura sp.]
MSHELPEDESQWPSDPWRVLGVDREAGERAARKAYAALIRRFPPDQFPTQFQRVRAAYDLVLARLKTSSDNGAAEDELQWSPIQSRVPRNPAFESLQPDPGNGRDEQLDQRLATAWETAKIGRFEDARQQFETLAREFPGSSEVASRLYWIQRLTLSISPDRRIETLLGADHDRARPADWVSRYLAELQSNLKEAVRDRCRDAMLSASPYELAAIARVRWGVVASFGSWWRIDEDLEHLRKSPQFTPVMEATLLVQSAELRLWDDRQDHQQFWEGSAEAMRRLMDVHSATGYLTDRWDFLVMVHAERTQVRSTGEVWNEIEAVWRLLWLAATAPERELRRILADDLVKWIRSPAGQWRSFREMLEAIPFALHELGSVMLSMPVQQGWAEVNFDTVTAQLDEQVRPRQATGFDGDEQVYASLARRLYEFSVRQALPYYVVIAALRDIESNKPSGSLERLRLVEKDIPLKLLITASWLFWDLG